MKLDEYKALLAKRRAAAAAAPAKPKAQVRLPNLDGPNQTEMALKQHLVSTYPEDTFTWLYESISFRLPAGTLYTPDWTVWHANTIYLVIEVKGAHIHRGASLEKFKAARAAFPQFHFQFYQLKRDGQWAVAE